MIGMVSGYIVYIANDHILVDVRGVGYVIYCNSSVLSKYCIGEYIRLYTELLVREDVLQMFGFLSVEEREWHKVLITVPGVGSKVSINILSDLGVDGVLQALTLQDKTIFQKISGIGPKLASRIVIELRDKRPNHITNICDVNYLDEISKEQKYSGRVEGVGSIGEDTSENHVKDEVVKEDTQMKKNQRTQIDTLSALVNLGYGHSEAAYALNEVIKSYDIAVDDIDLSILIKEALSRLAKVGKV